MRRRQLMSATECLHLLQVKRTADDARLALGEGIGQVGRYLRHLLTLAQLLVEEITCSSIFSTFLSSFLVFYVAGIGVVLCLNGLSVHGAAYLAQHQVDGSTVCHQVMHVHQQIDAGFGLHYLHAVERPLAEVEGPDELLFIGLQLCLAHPGDDDFRRHRRLYRLHYGAVLHVKVCLQLRVSVHHSRDGLLQTRKVCVFWEGYLGRDIIDSG